LSGALETRGSTMKLFNLRTSRPKSAQRTFSTVRHEGQWAVVDDDTREFVYMSDDLDESLTHAADLNELRPIEVKVA
jgi:hypothetical protein